MNPRSLALAARLQPAAADVLAPRCRVPSPIPDQEGCAGAATPGTAGAPPGTRRHVWVALIVAIVAIVARQETAQPATSGVAVSVPAVGTEAFLARLANQGYIPRKAVDQERLLLERLVASGDLPAAALEAGSGATTPPYTSGELRLIEAVGSGQVPREALGTDLLERLAADGGIPRAAVR